MKKILLISLVSLTLTACAPSPEAQNQKLAKVCEAGIAALLGQDKFDRQIANRKDASFSEVSDGRQVVLQVQTKNKQYGYLQDEAFTCVFNVGTLFGPFGESIELVQMNVGETLYGKKDGQILGDMKDFLLITESVKNALQ
jgi:hypothetical protein